MTIRVSDHALVRFLERAGELDVPAVRRAIADSLDRSIRAAEMVGACDFQIHADGLIYVVCDSVLVTIKPAGARPR